MLSGDDDHAVDIAHDNVFRTDYRAIAEPDLASKIDDPDPDGLVLSIATPSKNWEVQLCYLL
jgi:hypothetical protein